MSTLVEEFRRNHRLRYGVWAILGILAAYGLLLLDDERSRLNKEYQSQFSHLSKLHSVVGQTQWPEREQQAQALFQQLQDKLWKAKTKGLAQAGFQTWLQEQAAQAKLQEVRVQAQPVLLLPGSKTIWQASAKLEAKYTEASLKDFLYRLESQSRWITTERLEMLQVRGNNLSILVSAYYLLGENS